MFRHIISIHAPRKGSDASNNAVVLTILQISIHAPRKGSDTGSLVLHLPRGYFNPRPPQGERLYRVEQYN